MSQKIPSKLCGRTFRKDQLDQIRDIIKSAVPSIREEIARRVCQTMNWFDKSGRPQVMSCKVLLLRLHRLGLIQLPNPTRRNGNGNNYMLIGQPLDKTPITVAVNQLYELRVDVVQSKRCSQLWNYIIGVYHYLGYKPLAGAQKRYLIYNSTALLGGVGFSAAAWTLEARDKWIGWDYKTRARNLHLIVNNSRFIILPWVTCHNLASKVLSLCAQRIREDFKNSYGYSPLLLETFVESDRFSGSIYKASNWQYLGQTKGRGKLDRYKKNRLPLKDIYVYALRDNFRSILGGGGV
jgi:hypothetical protein